MPIEARSNSALFRRAEQLRRWEESETNNVSSTLPTDKKSKIKFSDGCVFLAACAASDTEEVERLLEIGTDINTANVDGLTALHQVTNRPPFVLPRKVSSFSIPYENLVILVEFTLCCPGTNAAVERVFSVVNDFWTSEKSRLNVDTLAVQHLP